MLHQLYNDNKGTLINSIQSAWRRLYGLNWEMSFQMLPRCFQQGSERKRRLFVVCAWAEKRRQPRSTSGPLRRHTAGSAQASAHFPHAVFNAPVSIRHRGGKKTKQKRHQWRKIKSETGGSVALLWRQMIFANSDAGKKTLLRNCVWMSTGGTPTWGDSVGGTLT